MATRYKPLKVKSIKMLDYIVTEIEAGRMAHDQSKAICGSAHCLFGWVSVLRYTQLRHRKSHEYAKNIYVPSVEYAPREQAIKGQKIVEWDTLEEFATGEVRRMNADEGLSPFYNYAKVWLGLSVFEAETLYSPMRTIEQLRQYVDKFKAGYRLTGLGWIDTKTQRSDNVRV
jgi:hypothetical protein